TVADSWTSLIRPNGTLHHRFILNPCVKGLLAPIKESKILDAGCGEGYLSRELAAMGAKVIGVDFSDAMISKCVQAVSELPSLQLEYYCADIRQMQFLPDQSIDKVLSNLCFPNLETHLVQEALLEFQRILKPNGMLVFSILHPCFEAGLGGWELGEKDASGRRRGKFFKIDNYFSERTYERLWKSSTGPFPQPIAFVHRTLETYFFLLSQASFAVNTLREPRPTAKALESHSEWFDKETRIPFFLVFRCFAQKIIT
ncbi:MAG: methyltransferase domain-containing protein, partial [Candidatus Hodarchaeota archaeon]